MSSSALAFASAHVLFLSILKDRVVVLNSTYSSPATVIVIFSGVELPPCCWEDAPPPLEGVLGPLHPAKNAASVITAAIVNSMSFFIIYTSLKNISGILKTGSFVSRYGNV